MIGAIIDGISLALSDAFPDYKVYIDSIEQGLETPCFQILPQAALIAPCGSDKLRSRVNPFDILYFPEDRNDRKDMMVVGELMHGALSCIAVNGDEMIRATEIEFSIQDGILHFLCNYNHHEKAHNDNLDYMETMENLEVTVNGS